MSAAAQAVAILIPARNEAATIGATLASLSRQDYAGPLQVVVCVNGDTEGTAAVVASQQPMWTGSRSLRVIELATAGKPIALNAADAAVPTAGPRIYLDADVQLSSDAVSALVAALAGPAPRVAGPRKAMRAGMPWLARFFARAWLRLPWVQGDIVGSGVVAVNASGRARWGVFPDVIADDGFAVWQFAPAERAIVATCSSAIAFPQHFRDLLRAQRRWIDGGRQLAASLHRPPFGPAWSGRQRLRAMLQSPIVAWAALVTRVLRILARVCVAPTRAASWRATGDRRERPEQAPPL